MRLRRLAVENLRLIEHARIDPAVGVNLLYGPNGSGKTTLLEAIYLLGRGKPLRGKRIAPLMRSGCEHILVTAELEGDRPTGCTVGMGHDAGGTRFKLAGQTIRSHLELVKALPMQFVHPEIHQLLWSGSLLRRQFIDRGLFHVEQPFLDCWRRYQRVLRQRNAALRRGDADTAWDRELASQGVNLARMRGWHLQQLEPLFRKIASTLLDQEVDVALTFRQGWPADETLAETLQRIATADRRQGFTQRGPHRSDFAIRFEQRDLRESASRGQQKLLLTALQLAQAEHLYSVTGRMGVILVDDLPAELDPDHRCRLLELLYQVEGQVWITATARRDVEDAISGRTELKVFHVEQGRVESVV